MKAKTITFLGENKGVKACDLGLDNSFLDMMLKVQAAKYKIKWTASKFKTFVLQSTPSRKGKDKPWNEKKHMQIIYIC